jgi:hypothetical protein
VALALASLLALRPPARLPAQTRDTSPARATTPAARDTSKLIKPAAALGRSLLIPGWGQAAAGRGTTGALFVVWEGVTIMMTVRAVQEQHYMEETGSANVGEKRQQVQDWVVLWIFNHLFAGAEAFVSAHLQDFPKELKLRAAPGSIGVSLPLR